MNETRPRGQVEPAVRAHCVNVTPIDTEAHRLLLRLSPLRNISVLGEQLMHSSLVITQEGKKYSRQGYALFAGRWLRRLERFGVATNGRDGWIAR